MAAPAGSSNSDAQMLALKTLDTAIRSRLNFLFILSLLSFDDINLNAGSLDTNQVANGNSQDLCDSLGLVKIKN